MRKLGDVEKEIENYRRKIGRKPSQRASLISAGSLSARKPGSVLQYNQHGRSFGEFNENSSLCFSSDDAQRSEISSLSDSLNLDDGKSAECAHVSFLPSPGVDQVFLFVF